MGIDGESSRLSLTTAGSFTHAALGSESATGVGVPELEVDQKMPSGVDRIRSHPSGRKRRRSHTVKVLAKTGD